MYRTVLVPVDGSDASRAALRHAVEIAARFDATVHVLAVVEPAGNPLAFDAADVEGIARAVGELVDSIVAADGPTDVEIHSEVRRGRVPYEEILDYADEVDADVIVLGRRGTTTLPDAVLGSTADRLLRLATVPVVLAPPGEEA